MFCPPNINNVIVLLLFYFFPFNLLNGAVDPTGKAGWYFSSGQSQIVSCENHPNNNQDNGIKKGSWLELLSLGIDFTALDFAISGIETDLIDKKYTVTFIVEDTEGDPIPGALIALGDLTNDPGDYVFENILPGIYGYLVTAAGYEDAVGEVNVSNQDLEVEINMSLADYALTLVAEPAGGGDVEGAGEYKMGEEVAITAVPNAGWEFTVWTGDTDHVDDASSATATVTMPADDVTVNARFSPVIKGKHTVCPTEWIIFTIHESIGIDFDITWSLEYTGNTGPTIHGSYNTPQVLVEIPSDSQGDTVTISLNLKIHPGEKIIAENSFAVEVLDNEIPASAIIQKKGENILLVNQNEDIRGVELYNQFQWGFFESDSFDKTTDESWSYPYHYFDDSINENDRYYWVKTWGETNNKNSQCPRTNLYNHPTDVPTHTTDVEEESRWHVFPVPASSHIWIKWKSVAFKEIQIHLLNISGQQLLEMSIESDSTDNRVQLPVDSYPPGLYIIRLRKDESVVTKRILIK